MRSTEAMGDGHCGLPTGELVDAGRKASGGARGADRDGARSGAGRAARSSPTAWSDTPCVFLSGLYHAEKAIADRLRRLLSGAVPWPEIDADKALPWIEGRTGLTLAASQAEAIASGAALQGAGHHRRPRRRQDHHRELDPAHPLGQGRESSALRPHGTRRQAHDRSDRHGGQDHPPPARVRPEDLRLQARRGEPARVRPAGDRRGLDGRCLAHAVAAEGRPGPRGPADRRRHRPAAVGRPRAGARRHHRLRRRADGPADRGLPAGGAEPDHHQRPPDQPGPDAGSRRSPRARPTSTSSRPQIPSRPCPHRRAGAIADPQALRLWIRSATFRCSAR